MNHDRVNRPWKGPWSIDMFLVKIWTPLGPDIRPRDPSWVVVSTTSRGTVRGEWITPPPNVSPDPYIYVKIIGTHTVRGPLHGPWEVLWKSSSSSPLASPLDSLEQWRPQTPSRSVGASVIREPQTIKIIEDQVRLHYSWSFTPSGVGTVSAILQL